MSIIKPANILVPNKEADLFRYSCVACDQFTGDKEYWEKVEEYSQNTFSTYNMIFPEIYLGKDDENRIRSINANMEKFMPEFTEYENSVFYIERTLNNGKIRRGLVLKCDLEEYEYKKGTTSLIRPTEGTIEDRLPPRVKIREKALLEFPHIMLLINDQEKKLIESVEEKDCTLVYDTELMLQGGSIKGYRLTDEKAQELIERLPEVDLKNGDDVIRIAVGDGNHSLATAKKCWENIKKTLSPEEQKEHPARYALCEIVNLHDEALEFEPIHRILYNVDVEGFIKVLEENYDQNGQKVTVIVKDEEKDFYISPSHCLTVGSIQNIIDAYLKNGGEVDYIHEPEQVRKNAMGENAVGLLIPGLDKKDLFPAVLENGALPRKTFSMGMGIDKRYYFEARKIK